jgi:hypothetical protein
MIRQEFRVNGEFYVAPAYNLLIEAGAKIGYFNIGSDGSGMHGLGTPGDLQKFVAFDISKQVSAKFQPPGAAG